MWRLSLSIGEVHQRGSDIMIHVEAPRSLAPYLCQADKPWVFLAGGITDCPLWQTELVEKLSDTDLLLLNPRRDNFDVSNPYESIVQIEWEATALKAATYISFWFCAATLCPITLYELGYWSAMRHKPIVIGIEPGYQREIDVRTQTELCRKDIKIVNSLDDLAEAIKNDC